MKKAARTDAISTHDMRFKFDRVLRAVKEGRSLTLTYRNKPLARIVPVASEAEITPEDTIFKLKDIAEPMGPLTNAEIDAAIYGT
jgi:prevent-host-death family protein